MKTRTALILTLLAVILAGSLLLILERSVRARRSKENRELCWTLLKQMEDSLRLYHIENGGYPKSLAALYTSRFNPGYRSDPWGRAFVYAYPAAVGKTFRGGFSLFSVGPNGVDENGEGDDVVR